MPRKPANPNKEDTAKKTARKKKAAEPVAETAADVIADAPTAETAPKKRGRKPKNTVTAPTEAPAKKRGRRKVVSEMTAEAAPPVDAAAAFDVENVDMPVPETVVELPDTTESAAPEAPAKKTRKPRTRKTPAAAADAAPKKRGRKPKAPELVLQTTLQVGEAEFDISAIAEKAYKEYKRVHKRKTVTDFHVYVKPEEGAAYFTVNGEGSEDFRIDLT